MPAHYNSTQFNSTLEALVLDLFIEYISVEYKLPEEVEVEIDKLYDSGDFSKLFQIEALKQFFQNRGVDLVMLWNGYKTRKFSEIESVIKEYVDSGGIMEPKLFINYIEKNAIFR